MRRPTSTSRPFARAAALAAAAVALSALGAGAGSARRASPPRCATSGLVVWLDTQGNGAAGSVFYHLELTNLTLHACTLVGFPGVSAVDLAGHRLGSPATWNHAQQPERVTLGAGASASALLRIVQAANYPASTCRPVTAAGLRVYPPNQTAPRVVPFPFRACARRGPVVLTVDPVRKA